MTTTGVDQTRFAAKQNDKIAYFTKARLGKPGSNGTFVFEGTFGGRPVAVKGLPGVENNRKAENEIEALINYDSHRNIVRYFGYEIKQDFGYILALELCQSSTLEDWVKLTNKCTFPVQIEGLEILRQVTEGMSFLHKEHIGRKSVIHRDLKPTNILFHGNGNEATVKISDFGISRVLEAGRSSRSFTSPGGTEGWKAPEVLEAEEMFRNGASNIPKWTKSDDIFSLGCIFYYVLTNGTHPFGEDRNENIKRGHFCIDKTFNCLRLRCNWPLFESMIAHQHSMRPDAEYIRSHPIFWTNRKMLEFIVQTSNFVSKKFQYNNPQYRLECSLEKVKNCVRNLEQSYFNQISNDRLGLFFSLNFTLKPIFERNSQFKNKNRSVKQLIRVIRNITQHYYEDDFDPDLKLHFGSLPDNYMANWLIIFPGLINEIRGAFQDLRNESCLQIYYDIEKE